MANRAPRAREEAWSSPKGQVHPSLRAAALVALQRRELCRRREPEQGRVLLPHVKNVPDRVRPRTAAT